MSKYSDFYPAAAGTAFPFTGSGGITGSLEVRGGVGFRYQSEDITKGWTTLSSTSNIGTGRYDYANAKNSGVYSSYIAGGRVGSSAVATTEEWDGSTKTWSQNSPTTDLPSGNRSMFSGGSSTDGWTARGTAGAATNFWDGVAWANTSISWPGQGDTTSDSSCGSRTSALVFGGDTGPSYTNQTYYGDGLTWASKTAMSSGTRANNAGLGTALSALSVGGARPGIINSVEEYNGTSDTWSSQAPLPVPRQTAGIVGNNINDVLVFGGSTGTLDGGTLTYDGFNWSNLSPTINMNIKVAGINGFGGTDLAFTAGGYTPSVNSVTQEYNANTTVAGKYETFNYSEQTGATTVSNLQETSAERFKENIKDLPSQTEKIKNLQPVQYSWKHNNKQDIGFIAERFDNHYPELVKKNEKGETEGIQYSHVVSVLIKELQDQQAQIEEIQQKIDARKK